METPTIADISQGQRGVFILLEGLDRSGKSTHAKNLVRVLQEEYNIPTQFQAFPDRTTITGQKINDFLQNKIELNEKEIHKLFLSNRFEAIEKIEKILNSGINLVVDRYSFSGACFSAAKKIQDMDFKLCFSGEIGLPAPDIVIYMNVSPEIAEKRGGYGEERFETKYFQAAVRQEFNKVINMSPSWGIQREKLTVQLKEAFNEKTRLEQEEKKVNFKNGDDDQKADSQEVPQEPSTTTTSSTHQSTNIFPIRDNTSPHGYITPWYKVSSDGEFDETAKAVLNGASQAINIRKFYTIDKIQQFPELDENLAADKLFSF